MQTELLFVFPHYGLKVQLLIYKSAAIHPPVFKPPTFYHLFMVLCSKESFCYFSGVSRRSGNKYMCLVCTCRLISQLGGKEKVAHRLVDNLSRE